MFVQLILGIVKDEHEEEEEEEEEEEKEEEDDSSRSSTLNHLLTRKCRERERE